MFERQNSGNSGISVAPSTQQLAISRFMARTYGWMSLGLALTAMVSFFVLSSESAIQLFLGNRFVFYTLMFGELGLVMWLTAAQQRLSAQAALTCFLGYSALNGITFSVIFMIYTMESIGQIFLLAAGMFGGLALFGTATKRDLTPVGTFFAMGVWGMILIGIVNLFIGSESLSLGLATAGVLIFSGLTTYDAQRIRSMAYHTVGVGTGINSAEGRKASILGALSMYLNFINLFLSLLRLFGKRRD